jgi:AhpD family alkylhydroperoxidase
MLAPTANPALSVPGAFDALYALAVAAGKGGLPHVTTGLVYLLASQINGCRDGAALHARDLLEAGESGQRVRSVADWRDAPCYTGAERAALALTEALTRISDRADPVPDGIYAAAARHFGEPELASLLLHIALVNAWNRLDVTARQPVMLASADSGGAV